RRAASLSLFPYTTLFRSRIFPISASVFGSFARLIAVPAQPSAYAANTLALSESIPCSLTRYSIRAADFEVIRRTSWQRERIVGRDRKSTRLNSSHLGTSY